MNKLDGITFYAPPPQCFGTVGHNCCYSWCYTAAAAPSTTVADDDDGNSSVSVSQSTTSVLVLSTPERRAIP